jgi:hypothetical protein
MKKIKESTNGFPRQAYKSVDCRKRDLVIRIANWTKLSEENSAGYDVEVYIGGIYDFNESETFAISNTIDKSQAKNQAIKFAQKQIAKLL